MSIAVTAPEKFDFQDLACIELMLRFEAHPDAIMFAERDEGEDAEIVLPHGTAKPLIIEVQVKGASGPVTIADIVACLAHCPAREGSNCLFERLMASPNKIALLIMSGRCDDTASIFVTPFNWKGTLLPAGRIKTATATAFLEAFGDMPAASATDLMVKRKTNRDRVVSSITPDTARNALDRVLVFERVGDAELEIACDQHLRSKYRIPKDRIPDVISRLRGEIKLAKRDKTNAIPPMRALLAANAPVSLRPGGYMVRGIEAGLFDTLSAEKCLLLSGPPRCGKSDAARWVAAEFEPLGYDVQQGTDFDSASRFLLDPAQGERLFVLDDPLGGAHPDPESGRTLERLANLISRLPSHRKIIVAQSQDVIFTALGRTQLQACTVAGHSWADLGVYSPEFLSRLWVEMATLAGVPPSLKDRMAEALNKAEIVLEPGCLQHLASSRDALSGDMPLDQAVRIAREPARSLGQALATQASMANLLTALAIGSTPSDPIAFRELAFAMDVATASLPGKIETHFQAFQLGGGDPTKVSPAYDKTPAIDHETELDLEKLESRGIVNIATPEMIRFTHPYYRAAAETILQNPTNRLAGEALRIAERALFCLAPATSRSSARNLDWLHAALSNKAGAQDRLVSICVDGLRALYPATRDLCFLFLLRHLAELNEKLKRDVPGWARAIAHVSLNDIRWENGEATFPSERSIDGHEWFKRSLRRVSENEASAETNALDSEEASYLSPERAAKALTSLKRAPAALTVRAMGRFLSYDEAVIRAEATRIWMSQNRANDSTMLMQIFDDQSPIVVVNLFAGACTGWDTFPADRQTTVIQGLRQIAANPFAALVLLDRLVLFNREEHYGEPPPWPIFAAVMPIVLQVLPLGADVSEPRLYSVMRDASKILSADAVIQILGSWTSWLERDLSRGILPDEYALGVSDLLLAVTKKHPGLRATLVKRLFALPGTGASMAIIRDFVDAWPDLEPAERTYVTDAITTKDRQDGQWLRALVLTRRVVPSDLQEIILGDPAALSAKPSDLIRDMPPELLNASVAVYCGQPQPLWWLGTHHSKDTVWEKVVQEVALRPDHPQFETALAEIIFHQDGKNVAAAIESAGSEHLQRLFEILLEQRSKWNGNYLSEAWEALFNRATDAERRKQWLDRLAEEAPFMLDDLNEIEHWLTGPSESEDLFKRLAADLNPLMMLYGVKDLSPAGMKRLRDPTLAALKAMLTKMPPRLFGTYDHIRSDCEFIGIDDSELTDLLNAGRAKVFADRDKRRDEKDSTHPRLEGWIAP